MSMAGKKVPFAEGKEEFTEKKSRFIGHIFQVTSTQQAMDQIKRMQKEFWDASCVAYAYIVEEGQVMRFSDAGEPQGTAGLPILEVLKKEGIFDVLCVVVRYFGGIKLGAGGLTRAYGHGAKIAVDAAGVAEMVPFRQGSIPCDYSLFETVRSLMPAFDAQEDDVEYSDHVVIHFSIPDEKFDGFAAQVVDSTSGRVTPRKGEVSLRAKRVK